MIIYDHLDNYKLNKRIENTKVCVPFTKPNSENAYLNREIHAFISEILFRFSTE